MVKKKEENAIAVSAGNTPAEMIRLAISGKADLAKLEKLLELQERHEAHEAKKVFASAFALVQASIVSVAKTKSNPQTHSKYAGLDEIIESTKPIYTNEGFSIIFYEGQSAGPECIRICADVLHTAGHKETFYYDVPLDGVGIKGNPMMTKIHAKASSTSYGRRYLMCMIWNIPTGDDDDGNSACKSLNQPNVSAVPQNQTKQPQIGANPPAPVDIPETEEMNARAAVIADDFEQCENLMELAEKAAKYRTEINTKMSKSYRTWLKDTYTSVTGKLQEA